MLGQIEDRQLLKSIYFQWQHFCNNKAEDQREWMACPNWVGHACRFKSTAVSPQKCLVKAIALRGVQGRILSLTERYHSVSTTESLPQAIQMQSSTGRLNTDNRHLYHTFSICLLKHSCYYCDCRNDTPLSFHQDNRKGPIKSGREAFYPNHKYSRFIQKGRGELIELRHFPG